MPNLRIVTKNALRQAASFTASSTAGNLAVASLAAAVKSSLHRFTSTSGTYKAAWAAPARIGCVSLPFCNWSPTAKMRVRVSTEQPVTNLVIRSEEMHISTGAWARAAVTTVNANVTAAPNGTNTADQVVPTTTATSHYLDYSITGLADDTTYSGAVFFKRDTLMRACFNLTAKDGSGSTVEVNFEDGRMTRMSNGTGQDCKFKVTPAGGGWYRLFIENWSTRTGATVPRFRLFASQHNEISKSGWANTSATTERVTDVVSPYPNWGVDKLVELTGNSGHYTTCSISCQTGRTVVLEQTFKALGTGSTRYGAMVLTANTGLAANRWAVVNLATGAITGQNSGTECVFSTEDMGNGFWKLVCQFTPDRDGTTSWQIRGTNASNNAAPSYTGDGVSGVYVCKPYAYTLVPVADWAPFSGSSEGSVVGDGTTGFHAWGAMLRPGPKMDSYYPSVGTVQGQRPLGYIDSWQSYDYDSGWVLACPAPAVELESFTPAQAASAYAYGGGAYARHWLPQQFDATGLTVDIADPDNLQGYIEAACMVVGPVWSPKYNASATSVSMVDRTEVSRSAAGDQLADPGTLSRKVPVDLRAMPEADRARFLDLLRNSRAYPVLLSVFPEHADVALERDFMVYGRRTKDSDIAYQFAGAYSTTLEVEEI